MKPDLLEILQCPHCGACLRLAAAEDNGTEIRRGRLLCAGAGEHAFEIRDGIVRFATGLANDLVRREIAYEDSTYVGSDRLRDRALIARFPDSLAELWPHTRHFGPDFRQLISRLGPRPGDWVLDVGTGPCWSSRLLAERGARVIALDINDADYYGLRTADFLFEAHGIYFDRVLESMTNLPFRDGALDYITFNAAFHHTPDHQQTLRECFRILKPNGVAAMINEEFTSLRHRITPPEPVHDWGSHHSIPYTDLESAAGEAGFSIRYSVAAHVRESLQARLPSVAARALARLLEAAPLTLKQLNSALVILRKPAPEGNASRERIEPFSARISPA